MKNEYDLLKVFAIILVVIGHITILYTGRGAVAGLPEIALCRTITDAIYLFHMPLFISLSGAIFAYGIDHGKYKELIPFLQNKTKRILVPFLFIAVFALMPTLVLTGLTTNNPLECLWSIISGGNDVRHLWYIGAIFWCFLVCWLLEHFRVSLFLSLPISLAVVIAYQNLVGSNLFQIANGLGALPPFLFGMWVMRERTLNRLYGCLIAFAALVALKLIISLCTLPLIVQAACIVLPLPIIYLLVILSRWTFRFFTESRACRFILKNSFAIYLFHVECIYVLYSTVSGGVILMFVAFAISIAVSILLAYVIRKLRLQFLIGE